MEEKISLREIILSAFPGIEPGQAEEMIASGQVNAYPPGVILCHEGAQESVFYIILSGQVQVTKRFDSAGERMLKRLGPGGFFGEMAIIHNAPRAANVTTTEPTTVLEIHKELFTGLLESSKSVSLAIVREVSRRLRENDEMAIDDLRFKAKELAEAYQQLAEEEFARNQFLTTIAHELRTPLMAANGYLQALRMGMIQGDGLPGALDVVWRNMQEITALTNDILFLQEMELILPEFRPTDIKAVILAVIESERPLAERIGINVVLQSTPNLPAIFGDPKSLQRALGAILNNAIKFSPDGGSVLVILQPAGTNGDEVVQITVQDHGVGIPPDALKRIFQRFFHLDIICGRMFRGIGLGLSIAKHVIEQHHGTIEVQSEIEKGSTFIVRLPTNSMD
jgi:signal transduction histidine kinase